MFTLRLNQEVTLRQEEEIRECGCKVPAGTPAKVIKLFCTGPAEDIQMAELEIKHDHWYGGQVPKCSSFDTSAQQADDRHPSDRHPSEAYRVAAFLKRNVSRLRVLSRAREALSHIENVRMKNAGLEGDTALLNLIGRIGNLFPKDLYKPQATVFVPANGSTVTLNPTSIDEFLRACRKEIAEQGSPYYDYDDLKLLAGIDATVGIDGEDEVCYPFQKLTELLKNIQLGPAENYILVQELLKVHEWMNVADNTLETDEDVLAFALPMLVYLSEMAHEVVQHRVMGRHERQD